MKKQPIADEDGRLRALACHGVLDTEPEAAYEDLARLAASICEAPIALMSLIDADRQWFKARVGLDETETPREVSFCDWAIRGRDLFVVADAVEDARFATNPMVTGEPGIRFYAGAPIVTPDGHALGTICVIDVVPRRLTTGQSEALQALARQASCLLELRLRAAEQELVMADCRRAAAVARSAEARKAAILESSLDCIVTIDQAGLIQEWNPAAERTFGFGREEVLGRPMAELIVPPEHRESHRRGMARYLATGEASVLGRRIEILAIRKDGETIPVELAITVIRQDGPPVFTAHLRDITDRKRADEALRASEERFSLAVRGTNDGLWDWDLSDDSVYYSPRFAELLGFEDGEFEHVLDSWKVRLHPEDRERVLASIADHFERRGPFDVEYRLRRKGGDYRWFQARGQAIWSTNGGVSRMAGSITDVTDRRAAEDALRDSEAEARKLALVARHTDNAVIITDRDGRIEWVNEGFTRVSEYPFVEAIGRRPGQLLQGPETDQATVELMRSHLSRGEGFRHEIVNYSRSGRKYWLSLEVVPVRDSSGEVVQFLAIESDVTERKRADEALRRLNAELEVRVKERTADLLRSNDELRESQERFEIVAKATNDVIWDWSPETGRFWWSDQIQTLFGYRPGEVGADVSWWVDVIHPDDRGRVLGGLDQFFDGDGVAWSDEYRFRRADGSYAHVLGRGHVVRDDLGRPQRTIGANMDISERKRSEVEIRALNAKLEERLERLDALREIDLAISGSHDLRLTLQVVLDQVRGRLKVDAAAVFLSDPRTQALSFSAGRGFRTDVIAESTLRVGECYAGLSALERRTLHIADLEHPPEEFRRASLVAQEGFAAYQVTPLVAKGRILGVLEVYHRSKLEPDRDWTAFLEALGGQAAIAVDNATLFEGLQRTNVELIVAYDATIEGWSRALDLRDRETEGHTRRVTDMTVRLGRALKMGEDELLHVRRGALLHDIGKMGVPDQILHKAGPLSEEEWAIMRRHPRYAYDWLSPIACLRPALEIPYGHHERWDGAGYPRGLQGEDIPLAARVFAVVDIWDALRSDRPYRQGWPEDRVRAHIASLAGTHLDPAVVSAFLALESFAAVPKPAGRPAGRLRDAISA